jgi:hypothetical protein
MHSPSLARVEKTLRRNPPLARPADLSAPFDRSSIDALRIEPS